MKKIILYTASVIFIISSAFYTTTTIDPSKARVKTVTNCLTGYSTFYFYNSDGFIARTRSSIGDSSSYDYTWSKVIRRSFEVMRHFTTIDTMNLNKVGLVERIMPNNKSHVLVKRAFNVEGNLIQSTDYDEKGEIIAVQNYSYAAGNQITFTSTRGNNEIFFTANYTYYIDKPNTTDASNMGNSFSGIVSKSPVKSSKSQSAGLPAEYKNYTYHYDEKNRITIKASYDDKGKLKDSVSYSYY
jgi:hypothetical protein